MYFLRTHKCRVASRLQLNRLHSVLPIDWSHSASTHSNRLSIPIEDQQRVPSFSITLILLQEREGRGSLRVSSSPCCEQRNGSDEREQLTHPSLSSSSLSPQEEVTRISPPSHPSLHSHLSLPSSQLEHPSFSQLAVHISSLIVNIYQTITVQNRLTVHDQSLFTSKGKVPIDSLSYP